MLVGDLIAVVLATYDDLGAFPGRVRVSVPRIATADGAATNLALNLHKLATNSVKCGALSPGTGTADIACTVLENDVALVWTEHDGPKVTEPNEPGFGSKLVARLLAQIGGTLSYDWSKSGMSVTMKYEKRTTGGLAERCKIVLPTRFRMPDATGGGGNFRRNQQSGSTSPDPE